MKENLVELYKIKNDKEEATKQMKMQQAIANKARLDQRLVRDQMLAT